MVRRACVATTSLVVVAALAGCTVDGSGDPAGRAPSAAASGTPTTATVGRVTGDLDRARRTGAREAVRTVVDRWFAAAYLGQDGPPSRAGGAFPGFSPGAAVQARRDRATTTNLGRGSGVDTVVQRRGEVVVDLLATGGRARAATARFLLVTARSGDADRVERITGRLYLTVAATGWKVIGYDVERGRSR